MGKRRFNEGFKEFFNAIGIDPVLASALIIFLTCFFEVKYLKTWNELEFTRKGLIISHFITGFLAIITIILKLTGIMQ